MCCKLVSLAPVREVITGSTIKVLRERIFASFSVPQAIIIDSAKCFVKQSRYRPRVAQRVPGS
jgi:hypothetical protein